MNEAFTLATKCDHFAPATTNACDTGAPDRDQRRTGLNRPDVKTRSETMKKFVLAALAASMLATPALAAPQQHNWNQPQPQQQYNQHGPQQKYRPAPKPAPVQYRNWQRGQRFDARYARNYREVDYRSFHGRLKAPPRGYHYVRSGNDVVLVALAGGLIGAIFAGLAN
jgi:Ni/Co efflux regulator RcnB